MPTTAAIQVLMKTITALSSDLPSSVKQGSKSDKIWTVMNVGEGETLHETFNRHFNAMFGEDCRDSNGHLDESDAGSNTQTRPARRTVMTTKLMDENNLEQPKLPFQRS
ncbi:hypothetical protein C0995_006300 [Termitomyces sp. Mi166|nr:hypothetical protein C0995_006300 [Termitomyces sp. Mi166\